MASRYWVSGGTGDWNSTTNWSATSGGAGGASVPTSADNVFIDANSGSSPAITFSGTSSCLDFNMTGAITPSFPSSGTPLNIYGNATFIPVSPNNYTGNITFAATSTGKTVTFNGFISVGNLIFAGTGGGWALQDTVNITNGATLYVQEGTVDFNGKTLNIPNLSNTAVTGTRTLTMGSAIINLSGNLDLSNTTSFTLTAHTATITMSGNTTTFAGGGRIYYNVSFTGTPATITGSNTFNILTVAAGKTLNITSGTTQTVTNITSNGVKGNRATIQSATAANAAIISTAATITASNLTVQDITKAGAGSITFRSSLPISGNTGINFYDRYWINGTGNTSDTTHWAYVSGGAGSAGVPTSNDSAYFDSASFSGATQTVTVNAAFSCLDMDWTGATNSPTLAGGSTLNIFGSLTLISTLARTYNGLFNLSATTTGKTVTLAGSLPSAAVTFNGVGGGWTLQDSFSTPGSALTLTNGSLNTNGQSVSFGSFSSNNSNTRTLTLGASNITVASNWLLNTITGLTFNAGTSTITMSGTSQTFNGGGATYNNLVISGTPITITGSNTFSTLTLNTGKTLNLTSGTAQTVTTFICNGTTVSPSTLQAVTGGSAATIALPAGRYFIRHTSVKDITITGATAVTSIAGTNVSGNTGITFVTKFEMGRVKNDGSFNWYSAATGSGTKLSG